MWNSRQRDRDELRNWWPFYWWAWWSIILVILYLLVILHVRTYCTGDPLPIGDPLPTSDPLSTGDPLPTGDLTAGGSNTSPVYEDIPPLDGKTKKIKNFKKILHMNHAIIIDWQLILVVYFLGVITKFNYKNYAEVVNLLPIYSYMHNLQCP